MTWIEALVGAARCPGEVHAAREVIMNIELLGSGIHFITTEAFNRTIVSDGDALTLMDAGYPGNVDDVVASIREIGDDPRALQAILVTHGHVDHIGSDSRLLQDNRIPVLTPNIQTAGTLW
jgi:glyoxylase-like metal-dependent hydrolase (beta-lactamase superfamily II)